MSQPTPPPYEDPQPPGQPPVAGGEWAEQLDPPADEAERQLQATIRSLSHLEESN